jgi:hypothetical protein
MFCFAYLQVLSAFKVRRYLFNVGVVIIGRVFYFVVFSAYMLFVADFPNTFWATGIIDVAWSALYIVFALLGDEIRVKDLFLPYREASEITISAPLCGQLLILWGSQAGLRMWRLLAFVTPKNEERSAYTSKSSINNADCGYTYGKKAGVPDCGTQPHYVAVSWISEIILKMSKAGKHSQL